jgi:hypothetical protein
MAPTLHVRTDMCYLHQVYVATDPETINGTGLSQRQPYGNAFFRLVGKLPIIHATEHTSPRPRLKLENDEIRPQDAFPCVMLQKSHENACGLADNARRPGLIRPKSRPAPPKARRRAPNNARSPLKSAPPSHPDTPTASAEQKTRCLEMSNPFEDQPRKLSPTSCHAPQRISVSGAPRISASTA